MELTVVSEVYRWRVTYANGASNVREGSERDAQRWREDEGVVSVIMVLPGSEDTARESPPR
jgi:hypothetical protein